jgi:hypothetical protein
MKSAFAICLSATALMLTCNTGLGQIQQVSHCDCNQSGSYVGYQPSHWSGCDSCQSGQRGTPRRGNPQLADFWLKNRFGSCCATKAYPDSGWAPPAHVPVHYDGAWYGSYHPQALYGNPGGGFAANHPVVYAPTDTTQLGYYYTKVPTWQSRPDLIPPAPNPSNFHHRICPGNGGGCFGGHGHGGHQQSCHTCNDGFANGQVMIERPHYMTPTGSHVVRQAAPEKKGLLGGFRLTSMTELFE